MKFFLTHGLIALLISGCGDKEQEPSDMDTDKLSSSFQKKVESGTGTKSKLPKVKSENPGNYSTGNQFSDENSEKLKEISKVSLIQAILIKANPDYRGQGKIHEEDGEIIAAEFPSCGLKNLSPLRGLKLEALDLSGNPVREIRHLRGMPLTRLFLEYTLVESLEELREAKLVELRLNGSPVRSLSGLEGHPLENLYAVGTQINNISALASSNLRQLWLTESPVTDLSPLEGLPLVSLTAHRTLVEDLSFVRKLPLLQRLHIGETLIKDLSPLGGLNLTRLVFTPGRIERGMEVVRSLSNLREIGTKFDDQGRDLMPPDAFWAQFKP
jgi:hypothetical protein